MVRLRIDINRILSKCRDHCHGFLDCLFLKEDESCMLKRYRQIA